MNFCLLQILYLACSAHIVWSLLLTLAMTPRPSHIGDHFYAMSRMAVLAATLVGMARILQTDVIPTIDSVLFLLGIAFLMKIARKREEINNIKRACN